MCAQVTSYKNQSGNPSPMARLPATPEAKEWRAEQMMRVGRVAGFVIGGITGSYAVGIGGGGFLGGALGYTATRLAGSLYEPEFITDYLMENQQGWFGFAYHGAAQTFQLGVGVGAATATYTGDYVTTYDLTGGLAGEELVATPQPATYDEWLTQNIGPYRDVRAGLEWLGLVEETPWSGFWSAGNWW